MTSSRRHHTLSLGEDYLLTAYYKSESRIRRARSDVKRYLDFRVAEDTSGLGDGVGAPLGTMIGLREPPDWPLHILRLNAFLEPFLELVVYLIHT